VFSEGVQEFIYEEGMTKASHTSHCRRIMHARMEHVKERQLSDTKSKLHRFCVIFVASRLVLYSWV
jgi:hypothetical protein